MDLKELHKISKEQEIKHWIVHWFKENSRVQEKEILGSLKINYFEKGWIDSFAFIGFITAMDQEFSILFSNDEFQDRSFTTIDGLTQIIREKIDAQK